MRTVPAILGAVVLLLGCGEARSGVVPFTAHDSAGVQVVSNGSAGADNAPVTPAVALRIGAVEGAPDYQFFRLRALALSPTGEIFALDGGTGEVRVYDARGAFIRKCGRSGQGPGEFVGPASLWVGGDTIYVTDTSAGRMTLFGPDCAVLATWPQVSPDRSLELYPLARTAAGWVMVGEDRSERFPYQSGVERRDTTRLLFAPSFADAADDFLQAAERGERAAAGGGPWWDLLRYRRARRVGVLATLPQPGGPREVMTATAPLFEPAPTYAVDGRGYVHYSPADTYRVDTYDVQGRLVRRLTRAYDPAPVTEALVDRYRGLVRSYWDTASMGGEAALARANEETRPDLPHVPSLPPIGRMLASLEGALWVERRDLIQDPLDLEWRRPVPTPTATLWDRFDAEGRFLGSVALPPGFAPMLVGEDWVMGVLRDELDVQYVARLEVEGG